MYTSNYLKNSRSLKIFTHPGPGGPHGPLKAPHTSSSLHPLAIDEICSELLKPEPKLTHTAVSPRSLSQSSWMETQRHMRTLSGFCVAREGVSLPGCPDGLMLWHFLHGLCIIASFLPPFLPLCHIYVPSISMSVKGSHPAALITPQRNTWYLGNKGFGDKWERSPLTAGSLARWETRIIPLVSLPVWAALLFLCLILRLLKESCFVRTHKISYFI